MRTLAEKAIEQIKITEAYQASVEARRQSRDGVVVTPVEVVDFQIRSVLERVREIEREPDDGIEWLDPFGGTGIYTARLLQLVELPQARKRDLADNCVVIEIDPAAAQVAANNLARVYAEETGSEGCVRVICTDTFELLPDADLWADCWQVVAPSCVTRPGAIPRRATGVDCATRQEKRQRGAKV